jgi:hypothetical protein
MSRTSAGEGTPIVVSPKPPFDPDALRAPGSIPISAMVEGNTVYVAFTGNLGDVDYELVNFDTLEVVSDQVEGTGLVLIPFSGDSGSYAITFTIESGAQFYGEFDL